MKKMLSLIALIITTQAFANIYSCKVHDSYSTYKFNVSVSQDGKGFINGLLPSFYGPKIQSETGRVLYNDKGELSVHFEGLNLNFYLDKSNSTSTVTLFGNRQIHFHGNCKQK